MKNTTDFISTLKVHDLDETYVVSENNYKEIIQSLESGITISEVDNENIAEEVTALVESWYELENKTQEAWNKIEKEMEKYAKQTGENEEYIQKCMNTIKIIELFVEVRGWE